MQTLWSSVTSNESIKAGCEKCDKGYVRIPKLPIGFDCEVCSCLVESESLNCTRQLLALSGLQQRAKVDFTIDKWVGGEVNYEWLLSFVTGDLNKKWLFLWGEPGTGKTFTATLCAQIALLQEKSVYFTPVTKLLEDLRPDLEDPTHTKHVLKLCAESDLLILDDIGHEKSSQWVRERLYMIINERWNNMKPTIFTSNFPMANLVEKVSTAVYSRVKGESFELRLEDSEDKRLTS